MILSIKTLYFPNNIDALEKKTPLLFRVDAARETPLSSGDRASRTGGVTSSPIPHFSFAFVLSISPESRFLSLCAVVVTPETRLATDGDDFGLLMEGR
ncbi:hypothetical protein DY000_02058765 [Brassica cretica]|uniref:Uncharacterized protein n=1 Tax=Brassica cretica TaxID=69181 RepID=A0ABQ7AT22_BRACR|nr:hypothetical protein DY000_02058765 [Brassica cretica]